MDLILKRFIQFFYIFYILFFYDKKMVERMFFDENPRPQVPPESRGQPIDQEIVSPPEDEAVQSTQREGRRLTPTAPLPFIADVPPSPADTNVPAVISQEQSPKKYARNLVIGGVSGGLVLGVGSALLATIIGLTAPVSVGLVAGGALLGAILVPILVASHRPQ